MSTIKKNLSSNKIDEENLDDDVESDDLISDSSSITTVDDLTIKKSDEEIKDKENIIDAIAETTDEEVEEDIDELVDENEEEYNIKEDITKVVSLKKKKKVIIDSENEDENDECYEQFDDVAVTDDNDQIPIELKNEQRITDPTLTNYEFVRILGIRAKQIAMGSKVMLKTDNIDKLSYMDLAKYELEKKISPIKIIRHLPNNFYEKWKLSELLTHNDVNINDIINNINIIYKTKNNYELF